MKKRFFAAATAAILAVSAMSTAAFAAPIDGTAAATTGDYNSSTTNSTSVTSTMAVPSLTVTIPTAMAYVANPYRLSVKTGVDADSNDVIVNDQIVSKPVAIINNGTTKVNVKITVNAAKAYAGSEVKVITNNGNLSTDKTAKDIALYVEAATKKYTKTTFESDKTTVKKAGSVDWTFTGKYNAKTCALASIYTDPTYYNEASKTAVDIATAIASDDSFDANNTKALNSTFTADVKKADLAAAYDGKSGTGKAKAIIQFLQDKGVNVTLANGSDITMEDVESDTQIKTNLIKTAAVGTKPATVDMFTLSSKDAAEAADANAKDSIDNTLVGDGSNRAYIKISGTINQTPATDWITATNTGDPTDAVNLTVVYDITMAPNA